MSLGTHLDTTLNSGEEIRFKQKNQALIQKLTKNLHFSHYEIECIMIIHYKMQKMISERSGAALNCSLVDILHDGLDMTDYRLVNYIISTLERGGLANNIKMEQWGKMLSLFTRGNLEEKIRHCFTVYDTIGIDILLRNNLIKLLKHTLIKEGADEDDEGIKDMVDMLLKKLDLDRDGKISFDDYRQSILKQPLLLELFGPCTPSRLAICGFLCTFAVSLKATR